MEILYLSKTTELKREKSFLEKHLKVKIKVTGRKVEIDGDPLDEYEAKLVLDALDLGFSARTAILLKEEDYIFEKINIKSFSRRKNPEVTRARIIGTNGRTRKVIEEIADCKIKIQDNTIGIIAHAENIEYVTTAIINLIKGTKQTNVYKYLERINTRKNPPK